MSTPATSTQQLAPHVDHEVAQFLLLHRELRSPTGDYPESVRRAIVVAYASHLRVLLEFFHGGRPLVAEMKAVGCETRADVTYEAFVGTARPPWTNSEISRLCDADKLVGHLSEGRLAREGSYPSWGADSDLDLLRDHIGELLSSSNPSLLPRAHAARAVID